MLTELDRHGVPLVMDPAARARGLLVAFTGRRGGVSSAPFDTLNLSVSVGDDPAAVAANRRRAARACGFDPSRLALARQVHGTDVLEVLPGAAGVVGRGDALVARHPGPVLAVLTADCVPVLLEGPAGVAAVHAGWRGLAAGVVGAAVAALGGAERAWVGPAVRACCYEVGPEVTAAFAAAGLPVGDGRVDPSDAALAALAAAGVEEVERVGDCTCCGEGSWFSHRRDGRTGRQGAFVARLEAPR